MLRNWMAVAVLALVASPVWADEASHKKAAEAFLDATNAEKVLTASINAQLDQQIKANPGLAQFKDVMKKFFDKHISYKALKDDLIKIYVKEFKEDELKELTKFYTSPVGKKYAEKMPTLTQKGAELATKRIQDNTEELKKMILDSLKEKE
jgi:hypothetical protein